MSSSSQPVEGVPKTGIKGRFLQFILNELTRPTTLYAASEVTNLRKLKKRLRPGDVILACGDARISHIVKLLTLSQWSHVVMYVGDKRELLSDRDREAITKRFGEHCLEHLVIDADPLHGVHLRPVDDYVGLMARHCRALAIKDDDLQSVIKHALGQLGRQYDVVHIIRLLLFFAIPWEILPESLRRAYRDFALSEDDRICSRVLAEAFHSVGYPIRPIEVIENRLAYHQRAIGYASAIKHRGKSAVRLLAGGRLKAAITRLTDKRYLELHLKGHRHITPADYDLSRFFAVIKDPDDLAIDYQKARRMCPLGGNSSED